MTCTEANGGTRLTGQSARRCVLAAVVAGALALAAAVAPPTASASPTPVAADHAHTVSYDRYSLKVDGKRIYVWGGEFQYWRLPSPSLWRDVLQKMKAAGFNAVTIYFDWGYHSPEKGVYNFKGIRNVDKLLDIAEQVGIYVIARPGPYINAETDSGGFPGWLTTMKGHARTDNPVYEADYRQWLTRIDKILASHQLTNGTGTIILYEIENEFYDGSPAARRYMQDVEEKARADGITVPFSGNHNGVYAHGAGKVQVPGYDSYPQGFNCTRPKHWNPIRDFSAQRKEFKNSPLYLPEFQGGAFDPWGGPGYDACRQLTGPAFERVFYEANMAAGSTMQSFYMTYGGTSWGWLAFPGVYTSYDYGAAINESRQLTAKYYQQKLLGYFVGTVAPLVKTVRLAVKQPSDHALRLDGRINPDNGTQIYVLRHADSTANTNATTHVLLDLGCVQPAGNGKQPAAVTCSDGTPRSERAYVRVPQKKGTGISIHGRDSKLILADYRFGDQFLVYSTSQFLTDATNGNKTTAVVYNRDGEDGETVLRYRSKPTVKVVTGNATWHWNGATHQLRIDYTHGKTTTAISVNADGRELTLLAMDRAKAERIWKFATHAGPVLVAGPYLVRTASVSDAQSDDRVLQLTGDTGKSVPMTILAAPATRAVTWNGRTLSVDTNALGNAVAQLQGPAPVTLPTLTHWQFKSGAPETRVAFNDAGWTDANHKTSNNPHWDHELPVLGADSYGFHYGDVWYRGHFVADHAQKGILLKAGTGAHGVFSAWLNGHFLGSAPEGSHYFNIDPSYRNLHGDNVIAVLVANMGHDEDWTHNDEYKHLRGLVSATWTGDSKPPIHWKIQGAHTGADADTVRGPFNNGGLYGERHGWSLPGYADDNWTPVTLPNKIDHAGVSWYRTTFKLNLPRDQDVPIALKIEDSPHKHYRALIFINGWQFGRYINALGPQHVFVLPPGILNPNGENTIAISSWSTEADGGLGKVSLVQLGNYRTSLRVKLVKSPGCKAFSWCGR